MTSKKDILDEATRVVAGRGKSYGSPEDNFMRIARLWNAHMANRFGAHSGVFTPQDVSMMMALMKIARLENDPAHHDSWVDVAGYAACGGELAARLREQATAGKLEELTEEHAAAIDLRNEAIRKWASEPGAFVPLTPDEALDRAIEERLHRRNERLHNSGGE